MSFPSPPPPGENFSSPSTTNFLSLEDFHDSRMADVFNQRKKHTTSFIPANLLLLSDSNPNSGLIWGEHLPPPIPSQCSPTSASPTIWESTWCQLPRQCALFLSHNIPDLNLTDIILTLLLETHTLGLPLKPLVHYNLEKHRHTPISGPSLLVYTFPHGSTNKPYPTHPLGRAKKIPSTGAKDQTNLSHAPRGPTCPLALLPLLRGSPLLHWCCSPQGNAGKGSLQCFFQRLGDAPGDRKGTSFYPLY